MSRTRNCSEAGFTLAGLVVIMTVIAIMIAYTVPRQWSIAMNRERDRQTLFAMRQYARAMQAFQEKNHAQPVSLQQLKDARNPRLIRGKGEFVDPLTGQVDWIPIPMSNAIAQQAQQPNAPNIPGITPPGRGPTNPLTPLTGLPPTKQPTAPGQPGGVVGPIMGVRPNKSGESYLVVNGMDTYEQWVYTTVDLQNEIAQHRNSIMVK